MTSQEARTYIQKLPDTPGVYFFRRGGVSGDILYVGKATSLKDRVRSYFSSDIGITRGPKIVTMLEEADAITHEKTDSVLEALLLESHLIKIHQPRYNTKEKDDKSFYYVVITKEEFPRVLMVRGRDLLVENLSKTKREYEIKDSFGPFPSSQTLKEALALIRKIFPFRDKCTPKDELKNPSLYKPCFNRQIGLCPGVCTGEISPAQYAKTIERITQFFHGEKKRIIKGIEKDMKQLAKQQKFEEAQVLKRQLFALTHIHDVSLIRDEDIKKTASGFRIESYDIAHMSGRDVVGVMTVVEDGEIQKQEYRKFKISEEKNDDIRALSEVITRRFGHNEWRRPDLVVVDGGKTQKRAVERVLASLKQNIPVVSVVKDDRHKAKEILGDKIYINREREILLANSESHRYAIGFHKQLRNKRMRA